MSDLVHVNEEYALSFLEEVDNEVAISSPAAAVLGGSANRSRSNYFDHRRANINDLVSDFIKIAKPIRPEGKGQITRLEEFKYEALPGTLRDRYGNPITHEFIAVEGDLIEVNFGSRLGTYNNKLAYEITNDKGETEFYEGKVRCRTAKAEQIDPNTGQVLQTTDSLKPIPFSFYSISKYKAENELAAEFDRSGIEPYGRPDAQWLKAEGLEDRVDENGLLACRTCVANGWNRFGNGDRIDSCSPDGEVVMLVRRLAFVGPTRQTEWRNVEDFGIEGIDGPFIVVFDGIKGAASRSKDSQDWVRIRDVNPPNHAQPLGGYLRRLHSNYKDLILQQRRVRGFESRKDIYPIPTQVWIAKSSPKGAGNPRHTFLFAEANSIDEIRRSGLARVGEAWEVYRYERALAAGETPEPPRRYQEPEIPVVKAEVVPEATTEVEDVALENPFADASQVPASVRDKAFASIRQAARAPEVNLNAQ